MGRPDMRKMFWLAPFVLAACHEPNVVLPKPPPTPRVIPGSLAPERLLAEASQAASKLGAGATVVVVSGEVVEGDRLGAFVEMGEDQCFLAFARGAVSVDDLDLGVLTDDGNPIAADEAPDPRPTVLVCPPHPRRMYMSLHAAGGSGFSAAGIALVPKDRALEVGKAMGAKGFKNAIRKTEAWGSVDDLVRQRRASLGGTWEDMRRTVVLVDAALPTRLALPLEEGRCTDALVVPDEEVGTVELEAMDAAGRSIGRSRAGGRLGTRSLLVCSAETTTGSIVVRPHSGQGTAAVILGRAPSSDALTKDAEAFVAGVAPARERVKPALDADLTRLGYAAAQRTEWVTVGVGRRTNVSVPRAGTACTRIDFAPAAPLGVYRFELAQDRTRVAEGMALAPRGIVACGKATVDVAVESASRTGSLLVTSRPEPWTHESFVSHPVAAARMLTEARRPGDVSAPTWVQTADLAPDLRKDFEVKLGKGQCARVAVGVEGVPVGLELRAYSDDGQELDRTEGTYATSVNACASAAAPRTLTISLRSLGGKIFAVVGARTRTLP